MPTAIPFYKSPQTIGLIATFIAAAVALFPKVGVMLGLTSPGAIQTAVENVASVIALLAPVVGTIIRTKSKEQPITLTQAGADSHPVTVASKPIPLPETPASGSANTSVAKPLYHPTEAPK